MEPLEPPAPSDPAHWQLRLLGGLQAQRGELVLTRFGSRSVAALLARLALFPGRTHAREELIERLWPGVGLEVGRNRLRQALFTLRQLLEPPGPVPAPVLQADRMGIRVVPGALLTDARLFEQCMRQGRFDEALRHYGGELLPGFYDDWIDEERLRLAALHERAAAACPPPALQAAAMAPAAIATASQASQESAGIERSTLPTYLTRFFGRETEGARLRAEVLGHRLVTLLGAGGSGKTRLAVDLARALRETCDWQAPDPPKAQRFDLILFVPLAACSTRAQLLDTLLAGLQLTQRGSDPFEPLATALTGRHALLVLDNFEQLRPQAEDVIARLLDEVAGLHLLVTSQRALGLDGEHEFPIQPLALPRKGQGLDEAAINPAVALFVDRARAVRADFHLGPSNLAAIVELVQLLEGMPLAIELAAARVRSIPPAAMAELLRDARREPAGQGLALLARSGARGAGPDRHASMQRVVEWSWRLLEPPLARLMAGVTVFQGGFGAAAAQAVCGGPAETGGMPLSLQLDELVAHSLLRVELGEPAGAARYSPLERVREYAALKLDPPSAQALRARHRAWLADWAAHLPATPALAEVRLEMPNILAALASSIADGAPEAAVQMTLPLRHVFEDTGLPAGGLDLLVQAVERCEPADLRSQGHSLLGPLLHFAGRAGEALAHAERGLALAAPGSRWRARALYVLARVRWRMDHDLDGINGYLDEALVLAQAADDGDLLAGALALRAMALDGRSEFARAEALHAQALALWQRGGNQHLINRGRYYLAVSAQNAGRDEQALQRLEQLESDTFRLQDWQRLAQACNVRGNALRGLRRWAEAAAAFRMGIRQAWSNFCLHELAYLLWNLPRALVHLGEPETALRLAAFSHAFWLARFGSLGASDLRHLEVVRRLARWHLGARAVGTLWQEGSQLQLPAAVALAMATPVNEGSAQGQQLTIA